MNPSSSGEGTPTVCARCEAQDCLKGTENGYPCPMIGHLVGIVVAHRIGHRLFDDRKSAVRSLIPMLVVMVLISVAGLGPMHLDMNMRMGRM